MVQYSVKRLPVLKSSKVDLLQIQSKWRFATLDQIMSNFEFIMLLSIKVLITFRSFPSRLSRCFFSIQLFHSHSHRVQIGRQRGHNTNIISLLHKSALSLTVAHTRAPILTRTHTFEWAHTHEHTHTYETLFNNAEIGPLSTDYRM